MKKIKDVVIDCPEHGREHMTEWEHDGHKISVTRNDNGLHANVDGGYDALLDSDPQSVIEWVFNKLGIRYI